MPTRINDSLAADIAKSIGNPAESEIPTYGIYVVYANHRYVLTSRQGTYIAFDISVYGDSGMLLTDTTDVYIDALISAGKESLDDLKKIGVGVGVVVAIGLVFYILGGSRNG
jgi:hypothetical protein